MTYRDLRDYILKLSEFQLDFNVTILDHNTNISYESILKFKETSDNLNNELHPYLEI